MQHAES